MRNFIAFVLVVLIAVTLFYTGRLARIAETNAEKAKRLEKRVHDLEEKKQASAEEREQRIAQLKRERDEELRHIEALDSELRSNRSLLENDDTVRAWERDVAEKKKEMDGLQQEMRNLQGQDTTDQKDKNKRLTGERENLKKTNREITAQIDGEKATIADLRARISSLKGLGRFADRAQIAGLQAQVKEHQAVIERLKASREENQNFVLNRQKQISESGDIQHQATVDEIADAKTAYQNAKDNYEKFSARLKELQDERKSYQTKSDQIQTELRTRHSNLNRIDEELKSLTAVQ